jgi:hypothetical protein
MKTLRGGLALFAIPLLAGSGSVSGSVQASGGSAVSGARMTLFTPDLSFFRETRTDGAGDYQFTSVPDGTYRLGCAARGYEYQEVSVTASGGAVTRGFSLAAETNAGRWSVVGDTAPEYLEGTGWGTLLPSGEIFICHDSNDPVVFDTVSQTRWFPPESGVEQGCHLETVLTNGDVLIAGGSTQGLPQQNVVRTTKVFRRSDASWALKANLNEGRWYPGGVRLPDERILAIGGEAEPAGYGRTDTCEIYAPSANSWTYTGSFDLPVEMPPSVLLLSGEVLKTWRYAELWNPGTGLWRPAGNFVQARAGAAGGDHSDHEIVHLEDGRVMAVGIDPAAGVTNPSMVEFYSVAANAWSKGPTPQHLRRAPEVAHLPDGRVFAFGGTYTGTSPGSLTLKSAGQVANCTNVADLYDPATNAWRAVAPAGRWTHYHSVTVVAPDGRVFSTGGAGTGNVTNFGDDTSIEAYEPPYLFRGVRPRIDTLSTTDLSPGESFTMDVSRTAAVTKVVLLSARAASHWIDLGSQRYLSLPFTQSGARVTASVPSGAVAALPGWYLLFALVDDLPSVARGVRITASPSPAPLPGLATVTVAATDASASEALADPAVFTVTRTGSTASPLTVQYSLGGSAVAGKDYAAPSGYVVLPAGSATATVTVAPTDDALAEGSETVTLTVLPLVHYAGGSPASATATLADNDAPPGDSDADGLPDAWETANFGNLLQTGSGDPDGDGLSNAAEFGAGTNPLQADTDGDGMPDGWEAAFGLNPASASDAAQDPDSDGATNLQEYQAGTDPTSAASAPPPAGAGGGGGGGGGCGATGLEAVMLMVCLLLYRKTFLGRVRGRSP